jgi:ATP sulfurylase
MPITKKPQRYRQVAPGVSIFERAWFLALVIAIMAFGVYSPVLQHPFVNFDDQSYIVENSHISSGLSWSTVRWALTATEEAN